MMDPNDKLRLCEIAGEMERSVQALKEVGCDDQELIDGNARIAADLRAIASRIAEPAAPVPKPAPLPEHLDTEWIKAPKNARCLDHGAPLVRVWTHRATFECGCEHWFGKPKDDADARLDGTDGDETLREWLRTKHSPLGSKLECVVAELARRALEGRAP